MSSISHKIRTCMASGLVALGVFAAPAAVAETRVALVLPGSISDGGWNEGAYRGLKSLDGSAGYETAFSENVSQADIPRVVRGYADDGFDLIVGHGFQFGSLFAEIAPDYPDQSFFATTSAPGESAIPANALYIDFRYPDAAYAAGVLAALMSEGRKAVGVVGGGDNPTTQSMTRIFRTAAEATVEGLKGFVIITGDYNDAAKGREAASTMIGNGADVIWHIADITGIGAVEGAAAKNARIIGMFADQKDLAPRNIGTSFSSNNAGIVEEVARMVSGGTFAGGRSWKPELSFLWLTSYGEDPYNAEVVSQETWAGFQAAWADIEAGRIDTSGTAN